MNLSVIDSMSGGKKKQSYPTKDQYSCRDCKDRKFHSWADFENHHSQHAVQYAIRKLPFVKLVQLNPTLPDSTKTVNPNCVSSVRLAPVKKCTAPLNTAASSNNESFSPDDTWPGSCEELSPGQPVAPNKEPLPDRADNILDPDFIEQLGIEISFLNQASGEAQPITVRDTADGVGTVPNQTFVDTSSPNKRTCSISPADSTVVTITKKAEHISEEIEIISEKPPPISDSSASGRILFIYENCQNTLHSLPVDLNIKNIISQRGF